MFKISRNFIKRFLYFSEEILKHQKKKGFKPTQRNRNRLKFGTQRRKENKIKEEEDDRFNFLNVQVYFVKPLTVQITKTLVMNTMFYFLNVFLFPFEGS